MVELIYTDAAHNRKGVMRDFILDMEFGGGSASNDYVLRLPLSQKVDVHGFIFIDGTEYGGVVDGDGVDYSTEIPQRVFSGRSWHGVLAHKVVMPEGTNYTVSGDANTCIRAVITRVGLADLFTVVSESSGMTVNSYKFDRFTDAYTGLRKMLATVGAYLEIKREFGKVWLAAKPLSDVTETPASSVGMKAQANTRPVNHLVCAGEGEGEQRVVVHLYADAKGNISQKQTFFGIDEVAETYSFTSADVESLTENGIERLASYQNSVTADMEPNETKQIGDLITCFDPKTGFAVASAVEQVNVTVNQDGITVKQTLGDTFALIGG